MLRLTDQEVRFLANTLPNMIDLRPDNCVGATPDEFRRKIIETRLKYMGGDAAIIEFRRQNAHRLNPVEQPVQSFDEKLSSLSIF
jgi:hypothetical protein